MCIRDRYQRRVHGDKQKQKKMQIQDNVLGILDQNVQRMYKKVFNSAERPAKKDRFKTLGKENYTIADQREPLTLPSLNNQLLLHILSFLTDSELSTTIRILDRSFFKLLEGDYCWRIIQFIRKLSIAGLYSPISKLDGNKIAVSHRFEAKKSILEFIPIDKLLSPPLMRAISFGLSLDLPLSRRIDDIYIGQSNLKLVKPIQQTISNGTISFEESIKKKAFEVFSSVSSFHQRGVLLGSLVQFTKMDEKTTSLIETNSLRFLFQAAKLTNKVTDYEYWAPEALLSKPVYGVEADVWSFGIVLTQFALGAPLFQGSSREKVLDKIFSFFGTPTQEELNSYAGLTVTIKFPKYSAVSWSAIESPQENEAQKEWTSVLQRLKDTLGEAGIDLLKRCLLLDPKQRISNKKVLGHPFFAGLSPQVDLTAQQKSVFTNINFFSHDLLEMVKNNCVLEKETTYVDYLDRFEDFNVPTRAILIDWFFDISLQQNLSDETVHYAQFWLDRFLSSKSILQFNKVLLPLACLYLAMYC
eukprot:TRINITY_DN11212_c0_g1_i2.p1 TRINITY_DN11212_c0_g1~~TRINITY_DN11212_c0_g1_i2.p1  ORF type:complete len:528 (+),score=91.85 TRINITY_DN11212_c0_g1_i2:69-1652(+)